MGHMKNLFIGFQDVVHDLVIEWESQEHYETIEEWLTEVDKSLAVVATEVGLGVPETPPILKEDR